MEKIEITKIGLNEIAELQAIGKQTFFETLLTETPKKIYKSI